MYVIGHRGAAGLAPENSLEAFEQAVENGVDMAECDVQACKDGELILHHDQYLDRTHNGIGRVADWTLAQLRRLRGMQRDAPPTLRTLLTELDGCIPLNIELKARGTASALSELITRSRAELETIPLPPELLISANEDHIEELRKLRTVLPVQRMGLVMRDPETPWPALARELHLHSVHPHYPLVTPTFVSVLQKEQLAVYPFTVNTRRRARLLLDMGVDGVFTDYPNLIKNEE